MWVDARVTVACLADKDKYSSCRAIAEHYQTSAVVISEYVAHAAPQQHDLPHVMSLMTYL